MFGSKGFDEIPSYDMGTLEGEGYVLKNVFLGFKGYFKV